MMPKFYMPILSTVERAAQDGLREGLAEVLEVSNSLAPVDSSNMTESGEVIVDDLGGQVSYKTDAFPYEILQHENLELQHPNGGQPKFLEKAADEVDVAGYVARAVKAAFDG